MVTCAACQLRMIPTRAEGRDFWKGGDFWSCVSCDARWVSVAALRRRFGHEAIDELWNASRKIRGTRPCPLCRQAMTVVQVGLGPRKVPLDLCLPCRFIWFDTKEYRALAALAEEPDGSELKGLLDTKWKWIPAVCGMPVERGTHPLVLRPLLTWGLVLATSLVSIVAFAKLGAIGLQFGLIPAQLWRYGGLTLLTSFFLHAGWLHLIGNLYFLVVFGDNVEDYLGRLQYALLLLLATAAGGLLHAAFNPGSTVPLIGASGGISGVITFYALRFPRAQLVILLRSLFFWPLRLRASTAFVLWILMQWIGTFGQLAGVTNVSHLGHLGGAGVGLLFWLRWRKN